MRTSNNYENKDKLTQQRQYQFKESSSNTNGRKVGSNLAIGQNYSDHEVSSDTYSKPKSSYQPRGSSSRGGASTNDAPDHTQSSANTSERVVTNQETLRCYNCKYRVDLDHYDEGYQEFDCEECGNYIVSKLLFIY